MEHRAQLVFLCLILSQGAHSIEEYVTKLYEVFVPARFVSSLVSQDLALGFLVVNAALVSFGLWCWAIPVRSRWQVACGFTWFWTIMELGNGVGHSALALSRGSYFPGVATVPLLLVFAGWLAASRLVEPVGHAPSPKGLWMNQIGRNLTDVVDGILTGKRYLIHDRDPLFTTDARRLGCGLGEVAAAESQSDRPRRTVCTDDPGVLPGADDLVRRGCGKRLPNSSRITRPSATTKVGRRHCSVLTLGMRSLKAKCSGANVWAGC